jgi:hypothetical protein
MPVSVNRAKAGVQRTLKGHAQAFLKTDRQSHRDEHGCPNSNDFSTVI